MFSETEEDLSSTYELDSKFNSSILQQILAKPTTIVDSLDAKVNNESQIMGSFKFQSIDAVREYDEKLANPEFALAVVSTFIHFRGH